MIEILFLPGKGSSESSEEGKKGKSQIIFWLIQIKSHTCMILTQEYKDKQITFNTIVFVTQSPLRFQKTGSLRMSNQIKLNQVRV